MTLGILCLIGFLLLCGGLYYVYQTEESLAAAAQAMDPAKIAALQTQIATLQQSVAANGQKATTATTDLTPLEGRVAALEKRPAPAAAVATDLGPLTARIDALEKRVAALPPPSPPLDIAAALAPLTARINTLAAQEQGAQAAASQQLGATTAQLAALDKRVSTDDAALAQQVAALDQRVTAAEQTVARSAAAATQASASAMRSSRIGQALAALDAGQPLGDIPDAPPAVSRFAHANPPTEAELRLAFPAAAARAAAASQPSTAGLAAVDRMWLKMRSLVTVKEGDKILVGPPAATIIAEAQQRVEAGDLAGAVAALGGLDGSAAQAIAPWREQAESLLAARAALTEMAHA